MNKLCTVGKNTMRIKLKLLIQNFTSIKECKYLAGIGVYLCDLLYIYIYISEK